MKNFWRALIEVGFIVFLFYSNLLMGEFERSGMGRPRGLAWAIRDMFNGGEFWHCAERGAGRVCAF
jgi:hypothetical protein